MMSHKHPDKVLKEKVEVINRRCESERKRIERDECLISEMIDYLSDNKTIDVDRSEFCKDFTPALTFQTSLLSLPTIDDCTSLCPLQVKAKTTFRIDDEIVMCFKLVNVSSRNVCNVSGTVFLEYNDDELASSSRSVLCTFVNKNQTNVSEKSFNWHKFCPVQTDIVSTGQFVYLVISCPTPDAVVSLTIVASCAFRDGDDNVALGCFVEPHKWKHWHGVLTKFVCDPWNLNAPNLLTQSSVTSPDTFMMSICSLTAFMTRRKINFQHKSELQNVLTTLEFQLEKVAGFGNVLYSKVCCLTSLLIFVIQNSDVGGGSILLCGKERVVDTFLNKLTSMSVKFDDDSTTSALENETAVDKDYLLQEQIKLMEQLEGYVKSPTTAESTVISIDGASARNVAANVATLELKRLCLNDF